MGESPSNEIPRQRQQSPPPTPTPTPTPNPNHIPSPRVAATGPDEIFIVPLPRPFEIPEIPDTDLTSWFEYLNNSSGESTEYEGDEYFGDADSDSDTNEDDDDDEIMEEIRKLKARVFLNRQYARLIIRRLEGFRTQLEEMRADFERMKIKVALLEKQEEK